MTPNLDTAKFNDLINAVVVLDPQLRKRCRVSLCIVDAVRSIGAQYGNVVVPVFRKVSKELGVQKPTVPVGEPIGADPLPVTRLVDLSVDELMRSANWQNTSTKGGSGKRRDATPCAQFPFDRIKKKEIVNVDT